MASELKSFPTGIVPEFEEFEDCVEEGTRGRFKMSEISDDYAEDIQDLKDLEQKMKEWATTEHGKRGGLLKTDYDIFMSMLMKLTITTTKLETRSKTICQMVSNSGVGKINKLEQVATKIQTLTEEIADKKSEYNYAGVLKMPSKKKEDPSEKKEEFRYKKLTPKDQVIIVKPTEAPTKGKEKEASQEIREILRKAIPRSQNIKIKKAVNIGGGGVLLALDHTEDKNKILGNMALQKEKVKVSEPSAKKPKMILYDVPLDLTARELTQVVFSKNIENLTLEEFEKGFNPIFKVGPKKRSSVHWVIEGSPIVRKLLINKSRIFVDFASCRIKDYLAVTRCFHCQKFGHVAKHCRQQEGVCPHCASTDHEFKDCPSKNKKPVCSNCKKIGKQHDHKVGDSECECYKKALRQLIDRTGYGI